MTYFDPVTHPDEVDDTEPTSPDLTVEWTEPQVVATLLGPDGDVLLELLDRDPPGY